MLTVALRSEDTPSGAWQYDRGDGQEREQGAPERHLAKRIGGKLPFHNRIAAGEHEGRADHVGDPERDLVAPGRRGRIGDGHRVRPIGRISLASATLLTGPCTLLTLSELSFTVRDIFQLRIMPAP